VGECRPCLQIQCVEVAHGLPVDAKTPAHGLAVASTSSSRRRCETATDPSKKSKFSIHQNGACRAAGEEPIAGELNRGVAGESGCGEGRGEAAAAARGGGKLRRRRAAGDAEDRDAKTVERRDSRACREFVEDPFGKRSVRHFPRDGGSN
jgi:hypothetical protein